MTRRGFKVTTKVIAKNNNDELLLLKNNDSTSLGLLWDLPGGTLEENEKIEHCLERELFEEIGLNISFSDLELFDVFVVSREVKESLLIITYILKNPIEQILQLSDEHSEYIYVNMSQIEEMYEDSVIFKIIKKYNEYNIM